MQNKTSVDEKEPNEALQVKRSTSEVKKTYLVKTEGPILEEQVNIIKNGVFIDKLFL